MSKILFKSKLIQNYGGKLLRLFRIQQYCLSCFCFLR